MDGETNTTVGNTLQGATAANGQAAQIGGGPAWFSAVTVTGCRVAGGTRSA